MISNNVTKHAGLLLAGVICLLLAAPSAMASVVSYHFTVDVTEGPLAGLTQTGNFSYDNSIASPYGYELGVSFTDFDFVFNGTSYDETMVSAGLMFFDSDGALNDFYLGNNCVPGTCQVIHGSHDWAAGPGSDGFMYSLSGMSTALGDVTFGKGYLEPASVPAPRALGLFTLGLLLTGLGAALARRRRTISVI